MRDGLVNFSLKTLMIHRLRVKIGAEKRNQTGGFEEIDVLKKIVHEKYEHYPLYKNDIALLKLKHAYKNKGTCYNY